MNSRKKKATKHLVPIGTYVPAATKLALQAIAESYNKSIYEYLQDLILEQVETFEFEIDKLKEKSQSVEQDGSDLL